MKCIVLKLGLLLGHHVHPRTGYVTFSFETVMTTSTQQLPRFLEPEVQSTIDWPLQLSSLHWNVWVSICPMHCVYVLSGLLWLHLVPSQHSRGLSGRRKPIRELAEPLEWIQPSLEIENRALTQLTLSQNLHNTAQDTKTTPGSSTLEELVVYISLPKFSMTQWYCNTWFNLQQ